MSQQSSVQYNININYRKPLKEQIEELNTYAHEEIGKLYNLINQKVVICLRKNRKFILDLNEKIEKIDNQLQQYTHSPIINNEIINIKKELRILKSQVKEVNSNAKMIIEEKIAENSEQIQKMSKIIDCNSGTLLTNDIESLKLEMKQLKDRLNSSDFVNTQPKETIVAIAEMNASQIKSAQSESVADQVENKKPKNDIRTFKSEIKKIITKALSDEDKESNLKLVETKENSEETKKPIMKHKSTQASTNINFRIFARKLLLANEKLRNDINLLKLQIKTLQEEKKIETTQSTNLIIPDEFIKQIKDSQSQILQLTKENESLKKELKSFKEEISHLIQNQQKKEKITIPKEIIQQINEVKSQSSIAVEEASKASKEINEVNDYTKESQYKAIEANFKANEAHSDAIEAINTSMSAECKANDASFKATEAEFKASIAIDKVNRIISDNDKMNVDIRCLKYEVKKLRSRVSELEQSKVSVSNNVDTSENVSETMNKTNEVSEKVENLINASEKMKFDIQTIKTDVLKIKESQSSSKMTDERLKNNNEQ